MIKNNFNFDSLMNLIFIILDAAVIYLMISTITELTTAIAAFELDPRSRPPFDIGKAPKLYKIFKFWADLSLAQSIHLSKLFGFNNKYRNICSDASSRGGLFCY